MNASEINRAIAEELGWKKIDYYEDNAGPGFWHGIPPISEEEAFKMSAHRLQQLRTYGEKMPNYHGDMNAIHESEMAMSESERVIFRSNLIKVVCTQEKVPTSFAFHATAAQRAEAFLRTKGRWKD